MVAPIFALMPIVAGLLTGSLPMLHTPPLPPDAALVAAAPEAPLVYLAWAGAAEADPNSANVTERLMAEPQVRAVGATVDRLVGQLAQMLQQEGGPEAALGKALPALLHGVGRRPGMIYVDGFVMDGNGPPKIRGAIVVNGGAKAGELAAAVQTVADALGAEGEPINAGGVAFKPMPIGMLLELPDADGRWAQIGTYVVITLGDTAPAHLAAKLGGAAAQPPAWLAAVHERLAVERPATVSRIDIAGIRKTLGNQVPPEFDNILAVLGLDSVTSVSTVGGLDATGYVSRSHLALDGRATGMLGLIDAAPLTTKDLAHIPAEADVAAVARLDLADGYQRLRKVVEALDPRSAQEMDEVTAEIAREMGVALPELFKALGTTWSVHSDTATGGPLHLGAVLSVDVRDRAVVARAVQRFEDLLIGDFGNQRRSPRLRRIDAAGQKITFIQMVDDDVPIAPAWVLTDDRFMVGLFPQSVRTQVERLGRADGGKTLADVPGVKAQLEAGGLLAVASVDMKKAASDYYPFTYMLASVIASEMIGEGMDIDASVLPDAATLVRHLGHRIETLRRTDDGLLVESRGVLPINGGVFLAAPAFIGGFAVVEVPRARQQALQMQTMNNMRQATVAVHAYAADHQGQMPDHVGQLGEYINNHQALLRDPQTGAAFIYLGKGLKLGAIEEPHAVPIFVTAFPDRGMRMAGYADGHVQQVPEGFLRQQIEKAGLDLPVVN